MTAGSVRTADEVLAAMRGRLLSFEGIDGAGKSTTARAVVSSLNSLGAPALLVDKNCLAIEDDALRAHAAALHELIYHRDSSVAAAVGEEHWFFALAGWYHLIQKAVVEPALASGVNVVLDAGHQKTVSRYVVSGTLPAPFVRTAMSFLQRPDVTVLLEIEPRSALERKQVFSPVETGRTGDSANSFDTYQTQVAQVLAQAAIDRGWARVPVDGLRQEQVLVSVLGRISAWADMT